MSILHEILAAEKTVVAAWHTLREDTLKKFKNPTHFFSGHTKALSMIEDSPANRALEAQGAENKPVATTVYDTLDFALALLAKEVDLQLQKNTTNQAARGDVMFNGEILFADMPVDQLMGLEARLGKLREVFLEIPTLDATKDWERDTAAGHHAWRSKHPDVTVKTDKRTEAVVLVQPTKEHPAQVDKVTKDVPVGTFRTVHRSGAVTAWQKANTLKRLDNLVTEVKAARMRANQQPVVGRQMGAILVAVLMEPLMDVSEQHQ